MRHQDLLINHILESWVFPSATARNSVGSYVPGDIGRISYQTDTGDYYRLLSTAPTWALVASFSSGVLFANPTPSNTSSATSTMGGFGWLFTPVRSGKVVVNVWGSMQLNVAGGGGTCSLRYGTGTPPTANAAVAGTSAATGASMGTNGYPINMFVPWSFSVVFASGLLVVGTPYWFDMARAVIGGAGGTLVFSAGISAFELT